MNSIKQIRVQNDHHLNFAMNSSKSSDPTNKIVYKMKSDVLHKQNADDAVSTNSLSQAIAHNATVS